VRETVQRSTIPAVRTRQGASHTVQAYSYRRFFARRGNECRAVEFQGELVAMLRRRALAVGLDWVGAPGAAGSNHWVALLLTCIDRLVVRNGRCCLREATVYDDTTYVWPNAHDQMTMRE